MTGFGKASLQVETKKITVEVKSLNSKGLDLNTRMPSVYRENELALRTLLAQKLERGKVDFSLYVEITGEESSRRCASRTRPAPGRASRAGGDRQNEETPAVGLQRRGV